MYASTFCFCISGDGKGDSVGSVFEEDEADEDEGETGGGVSGRMEDLLSLSAWKECSWGEKQCLPQTRRTRKTMGKTRYRAFGSQGKGTDITGCDACSGVCDSS